ncbi:pyrroline-5-carboxylate reductase [Mobilisporobacter senegalensis]|uniref:Pyrroline-5-carboxylate reductase n=1 Tax=Mobilisporobacter senegalensis TaxID=1329262 RepID=A0A3N1X8H5_9FIRM|nr:pyrroline-5-carboxylate reductase [Mobilisporobacter senegalensis]ROR22351.1 pyrroline-5-carboxylate reductase [Mobilisporobacter senegalensis]
MALIGFIGIGNMGYAMLGGALEKFEPEELTFTDVNGKRLEYVKEQKGVNYLHDNTTLVEQCKYIVLSIKPQFYDVVLDSIKDKISPGHVVISIAPGISIDYLKTSLGEDIKIVRAMPNTPALVNEGMSGVCYSNGNYTEDEKSVVDKLFSSIGKYEVVPEQLLDAVICASGSSPAYVYMFIEALADSGVRYGIPRDKAYTFAAQTVLGAAKMVLETGKHPGELKDQVCSPGGTTIAGVAALEEYGFRNAIMKASDQCFNRIQEMKK